MKNIGFTGKVVTVLMVVMLAVGCGKKWKKPTEVSLTFTAPAVATNSSAPAEGQFQITGGELEVSSLNVFGIRKQSNDIDFSDNTHQTYSLNSGPDAALYRFDIPQGTYTDLRFLLSTQTNGNDPSIFVHGMYTNDEGETATVLFKYRVTDIISVQAFDSDGSSEVVLIADEDRGLAINLDIEYWFGAISNDMWEEAEHQGNSGNSSIHIEDGGDNSDLYEAIKNRIHDGFSASFE
jgi:hypothetical protein